VRIFSGARKRGALPCVFPKTHGEKTHGQKNIWRAFLHWRTANTNFAVRFFLAHGKHKLCRAFFALAHGKLFFPTAGRYHLVLPLKLDFFVTFAVRFPKAHGKVFFKKLIFVLLFISPLQQHFLYSIV
jgi:hypothetical protein